MTSLDVHSRQDGLVRIASCRFVTNATFKTDGYFFSCVLMNGIFVALVQSVFSTAADISHRGTLHA